MISDIELADATAASSNTMEADSGSNLYENAAFGTPSFADEIRADNDTRRMHWCIKAENKYMRTFSGNLLLCVRSELITKHHVRGVVSRSECSAHRHRTFLRTTTTSTTSCFGGTRFPIHA